MRPRICKHNVSGSVCACGLAHAPFVRPLRCRDDREEGAPLAVASLLEGGPGGEGTPPASPAPTLLAERIAAAKLRASPVRRPRPPPPPPPQAAAGEPHVEARLLRVVGCQMLTEAGEGNSRGRRFKVVMHPASAPGEAGSRRASPRLAACQTHGPPETPTASRCAYLAADGPGSAWTTLSPDGGGGQGSAVLRLLPDAPRGTLLVSLVRGAQQLAAGTVQVAELHKVRRAARAARAAVAVVAKHAMR